MPCGLYILSLLLAYDELSNGWIPWIAAAIAVVGVLWIAWAGIFAWRNKDDFRITVRRGRVGFHGRFPPGRRADTAAFLLNDVAPTTALRVIGNWSAQRVLRVTVQGDISAGQSQQIRNFLKMTLKG